MKQTTLITNGKVVLRDRVIPTGEVYIEDGIIQYAGKAGDHRGQLAATKIDAEGGYILPGFVDMHSDAIEKELEPRSGAIFPTDLAFRELEKKVAGHGITTTCHSFSFAGAEWGIREDNGATEAIRTISSLAQEKALIRNLIHLRFEITDFGGVNLAKALVEENIVHLLSFMDHTPGQGQYPTIDDYVNYIEKTYHRSMKDIEATLAIKKRGTLTADENIKILSEAARQSGIPMASHDDDNPVRVAFYKEKGVTISEFPVNLEAAAAAATAGNYVCVGGPNIFRGGSSGKGMRAIDAVEAGTVNIICSDYYPPSILHSVFKLAGDTMSLPEATAMASAVPAEAIGLNAGSLEEGKHGDATLVRMENGLPVVMKTVVAGVPVYEVNYRLTPRAVAEKAG